MTDPFTKADAVELAAMLGPGPRLIGLTGLAGAGKDEAAKALVEDGWRRAAFADRMRTAILALDPWVDYGHELSFPSHRSLPAVEVKPYRLSELVEAYGWDRVKRSTPEVRRLLQKFGTEAGRHVHGEDCWVDLVLAPWRDNSTFSDLGYDLVVTDVRFENEARAVREAGGLVVHIRRPGLERLPGGHASEDGVAFHHNDLAIVNDGPVEKLYASIRHVAERAS